MKVELVIEGTRCQAVVKVMPNKDTILLSVASTEVGNRSEIYLSKREGIQFFTAVLGMLT